MTMISSDSPTRTALAGNLEQVQARIAAACARAGRAPEEVRLVAVTKTVTLAEIDALLALGVTHLGENRVSSAAEKVGAQHGDACWHMIGTIQRRKSRRIAELFDRVDSVDRVATAESLDRACGDLKKKLPILLQVNVSGEEQKHGFAIGELPSAIAAIQRLKNLRVEGLMTMAPNTDDEARLRSVFRVLSDLAHDRKLPVVSMGMTNDFELAIEEGATEVRIGSALFQNHDAENGR